VLFSFQKQEECKQMGQLVPGTGAAIWRVILLYKIFVKAISILLSIKKKTFFSLSFFLSGPIP
jgi:hypothetical protein